MKKSTRNKLNMYGSVLSVLNDYQPAWQSVSAFANAKTAFETKLNQLRVRVTEQLGATTGVTLEKKLLTADLRKRILLVQSALFLLGRASGDVVLRERNSQTKTELERLALSELAARCAELKQDIDSHATQLAEYGVTQQAMDELLPMLQGIDELNNSVRKAIIKRKSITQEIADLEQELNELLRVELDRLILLFEKSVPEFYHTYNSARITINYGGGKGTKGDEPLAPAG